MAQPLDATRPDDNRSRALLLQLVLIALVIVGAFVGYTAATNLHGHGASLVGVRWVPAALVLLLLLFARGARHIRWMVGGYEPVSVQNPSFEQTVRQKYQSATGTLGSLGFDCLFLYCEAIPLMRLLLFFPALLALRLWTRGVPMALDHGRLVSGNPVFGSRDKTAYAHPNSFGLTFHTAFQDGSVLVSKNFGDPDAPVAPLVIRKLCCAASVGDRWTEHQRWIAQLESEGKRVDRQASFEAYRNMVRREQAI